MTIITREISKHYELHMTEHAELSSESRCWAYIIRIDPAGKKAVALWGSGETFPAAFEDMVRHWTQLLGEARKQLGLALIDMRQDRDEAARG